MWDSVNESNIELAFQKEMLVSRAGTTFKEIMAEDFLKLMDGITLWVCEAL